MSEAEATSALAAIGDTTCSFIGLWVSVTFAYMTVAQLVGRTLTGLQNIAIGALYCLAAMPFAFGAYPHAASQFDIALRFCTVSRAQVTAGLYALVKPTMKSVLAVGLMLSVYLMVNVRRGLHAVAGR